MPRDAATPFFAVIRILAKSARGSLGKLDPTGAVAQDKVGRALRASRKGADTSIIRLLFSRPQGLPHRFALPYAASHMSIPLVIIPTYDERDNARPIAEAVRRAAPEVDLLFVDDNSPDGTGDILEALHGADPKIHVLHKEGKSGLGRAYISGFLWALERAYDPILGMDADFSHDPGEIPKFLRAVRAADLVLGSRYVDGIRITNWPLSRLLLSKAAASYIRLITGLPVHDPTGGFRCYRRRVLETLDLDKIMSNGYSFLMETAYKTWMHGFRVNEIPITFVDRRSGYSKLSVRIFRESFWMVWKLALSNGFRRTPHTLRPEESA
jgi:dolichol-phosphate mannosyltransferase